MAFASIYVPEFLLQAVLRVGTPLAPETAPNASPVVLVDGTPPVEKIVAANQTALCAGIELGMSKTQARDFLGVSIHRRSPAQERVAHSALLDLGWSISPRVEDTASDTVVLDLSGLCSLLGGIEKIAAEIRQRAGSFGLAVQVAVAADIETAIHAARGFPGVTLIPPGEEQKRLGHLPVQILSPSPEILETFDRWGIRTCAALAALPLLQLSERLGQEGVRLHRLARGAHARTLVLSEPSVHFTEEMELDDSVDELEPLAFLLGRLLDQLCARLEARSLAASAVHLRFDLERSFEEELIFDGNSGRWSGNRQKPATYEKALDLPVPMRDSKMLLRLVRLHLQGDPPAAPIRKLQLTAESARPRVVQGGLFLPAGPDPEKLELTVARIANFVGQSKVGAPELVDTHRPGEFRMSHFVPPRDEDVGRNRKRKRNQLRSIKNAPTAAAFRVFRPFLPARVALRDGRPVCVAFRGLRGDVLAASGPWRTCGDWWTEDPWHQDEWDIELRFRSSIQERCTDASSTPPGSFAAAKETDANKSGLYRICYDVLRESWFVRGVYD
jgi:protein ImuB